MNRRGFFAALLAAPLAAVAGLRPGPRFDRIWKLIDRLSGRIKGAHYEMHIWDDPWDHQFLNPPNDNPNWLADCPKTKPDIDYTWRKVNGDLWGKE